MGGGGVKGSALSICSSYHLFPYYCLCFSAHLLYMSVCTYITFATSMYLCLCVPVCTCVYLYVQYVYSCVYLYIVLCIYGYLRLCTYLYAHAYVCVPVSSCVCVYICVQVLVSTTHLEYPHYSMMEGFQVVSPVAVHVCTYVCLHGSIYYV